MLDGAAAAPEVLPTELVLRGSTGRTGSAPPPAPATTGGTP